MNTHKQLVESELVNVGAIPKDWYIAKINYFTHLQTGGTPRKDKLEYWKDGNINWMSSGEVNDEFVYETRNKITELGMRNSNATLLPVNSVMMALNGQGKTKGMVAVLKVETTCNQSLAAFIADEKKLHYLYLYYFLKYNYKFVRGLVGDGLRDGISMGLLKSLKICIPDYDEQRSIGIFLYEKEKEVKLLIDQKEKLIKLLEQQRHSIITEAVTKGLNPKVKMKDSGVEWISEIPEHWDETKLKFVLRCLIDAEHKTAPYKLDGEYLVARTTNIKKGNLILNDAKYTDYEGYEEWTERGIPEENDVLLTREAPAGEACVVPKEPILCLGQRVVLLKLNSKINSHFLVWSIYGGVAATYIKLLSQGSTVTHFNMADIKNIPLLLPGIEEQNEIVTYINEKANQFDELIRINQNQIELLKEYRQSLIYEAVTGKIDVSDMELD